jgi:hypothetical protein
MHSLAETHRLLEMFRRGIDSKETERELARSVSRLDKIPKEISRFGEAEK